MARARQTHERLDREEAVAGSSDRGFGLVFTVVFAVIGGITLWRGSDWWGLWGGLALATLAVALLRPRLLSPFNRLWTRFGLLLHHIVQPLVMGLLFYLTVTPTGLIMRALGKDPLRLKWQPQARSYWIVRDPPGPAPDSMTDQF